MTERLLSILSLCRKAGKLHTGFDPVWAAAGSGGVRLILIAADLSEKSKKEVEYRARKGGISVLPVPLHMDQLGAVLGKKTGIVGITDTGLAGSIQQIVSRADEDEEEFHR